MKKCKVLIIGLTVSALLLIIISFIRFERGKILDGIYTNDIYVSYQVKYPSKFKTETSPLDADSPDSTLYIYIDEDVTLSIYASCFEITPLTEERDVYDFVTDSGLTGKMYEYRNNNVSMELVLDNFFVGASVQNCSAENYDENKDIIFSILKSIQIK